MRHESPGVGEDKSEWVMEDGKPHEGPWPDWWEWELELSSHLLKRMVARDFTEVELRQMLEVAANYRTDIEPGRWVIETSHEERRWDIIVEPDTRLELLVVITAYPIE